MNTRLISAAMFLLLACLPISPARAADEPLPTPTPEKLPRWRGFNLLEKFQVSSAKPFAEDDFRLISKLGFNFVRLPMDYRCWIVGGDWLQFNEKTFKEIDQAIELGKKYRVHVSLNFHRAPGYTVASPVEKTDLWTDPETQRVCAFHWAAFARRYKGVPNENLSFNLFNEPANIKRELYVPVIRKMVEAIRAEDPNRLVISDGLEWGRKPVLELADLHIAQAGRGYTPMDISHYKANWVRSENYPYPQWPRPMPIPGTIAGPGKPQTPHAIVIDGPFAAATQLRLHLDKVSVAANIVIEADDAKILEKSFKCGPGEGEWKKAVFVDQWKVYQNIYDKDYTATIPAGAKQARVRMLEGDWMNFTEIGLKPDGGTEAVLNTEPGLDKKPVPVRFAPADKDGPFLGMPMRDYQWLYNDNVKAWHDAKEKGIGVMIGEWGAFNRTPHDVFLKWAEDNLKAWKAEEMGWAMWNFRGAFGVLDSGRTDVKYEDLDGHKLDRKLLELLQRY